MRKDQAQILRHRENTECRCRQPGGARPSAASAAAPGSGTSGFRTGIDNSGNGNITAVPGGTLRVSASDFAVVVVMVVGGSNYQAAGNWSTIPGGCGVVAPGHLASAL